MLTTCFAFLLLLFVASAAVLLPDVAVKDGGKEKYELIQTLKQQIKSEEEQLEKEERMNKNFERLMQFVNFLGQIDTFLSERTKNVIKKLALLAQDEEDLYNKNNI